MYRLNYQSVRHRQTRLQCKLRSRLIVQTRCHQSYTRFTHCRNHQQGHYDSWSECYHLVPLTRSYPSPGHTPHPHGKMSILLKIAWNVAFQRCFPSDACGIAVWH
ncbi:Lipase [Fusarium oxysporum f. sp. albedinis]|nr:Lipase [Fusarium oxysporum f. sp. albedinis]